MYQFLLVVHALVAAALVTVILMQRSEGGGLAGGGNPSGLMTARGAADFLTRATTILASLFVLLSIVLAGIATINRAPTELDTSLGKQAPAVPTSTVPMQAPLPATTSGPIAPSSAIPLGATPAPKASEQPVRRTEPTTRQRSEPAPKAATPAPPPAARSTSAPPVVTPTTTAPPPASAPAPSGNGVTPQ